jgi:hypothetical protein
MPRLLSEGGTVTDNLEKCLRCKGPVLHKGNLCLSCSNLWHSREQESFKEFCAEPETKNALCHRCKSPNEVEFGGDGITPLCRSCEEEWGNSVASFFFIFLNTFQKPAEERHDQGRRLEPAP